RRVISISGYGGDHGNTSACAEKRFVSKPLRVRRRKYLRVCGEEARDSTWSERRLEIPPRVRRREKLTKSQYAELGNTSACAEKRSRRRRIGRNPGKYLRVCGEEPHAMKN